MTVDLSTLAGAGQQFFDDNGNPLSGGKLYSYTAGTTTPQTTYTTTAGDVAHTNPIILNSAGRVPGGEIWLTAGGIYKFVLTSSTDVTIETWDNIAGIGDSFSSAYQPAGAGAVTSTVQTKLWEFVSRADYNSDANYNTARNALTGRADHRVRVEGGTVDRLLSAKLSDFISVKDRGAMGDGVTDDAAAIQSALNYCYSVSKDLFFPSGTYLVGAQIINKGVSMIGEGRFYSQLLLSTSFPAATSVILVQPDNGAYIDFLELCRFSVQPTNGGVKYGGTAIFMNFPQETNLSRLHTHDLYLFPGNDYSLQIDNNNVINFQGVPANSVIERCMFWEGMKLLKVGDSITIRNNVLRSSGGGRAGVHLYMSDTSGVASHAMIVENNIDCVGGALYAARGRNIKFLYNNVELSAGSGTTNGSVIDIDGSSGVIPWAEVTGNHIGIFGTASAASAIRLGGTVGCTVDKNTILSGLSVASGVLVTASSGDADIGFNEIQSTYTTPINNSGLRTMGVPLDVSTLLNGYTNTGGGYQPLSVYKSRTGLVTVSGVVNAPASPSGLVITTLPLGYRPATLQRFAASTVTGGSIVSYAVEVDTAGNIVCYCNTNTTRVEINATFQTLNYVSGSL